MKLGRQLLLLACSVVAILVSSCIGGQTGQPNSCEETPVRATEPAGDGLTAAQVSHAFQGGYQARLGWTESMPEGSRVGPVVLEEGLSFTVSYEGGPLSRDCSGGLTIPVKMTIATDVSGIRESSVVWLRVVSQSKPLRATFSWDGPRVRIVATLVEIASGASPVGTLVPTEAGAPGGWASFPPR